MPIETAIYGISLSKIDWSYWRCIKEMSTKLYQHDEFSISVAFCKCNILVKTKFAFKGLKKLFVFFSYVFNAFKKIYMHLLILRYFIFKS